MKNMYLLCVLFYVILQSKKILRFFFYRDLEFDLETFFEFMEMIYQCVIYDNVRT